MKSMSVRITSAVIALIMIACVFSSCKSKKNGDEEITRSNQVIAGPVTTAENGEATTGEETTRGGNRGSGKSFVLAECSVGHNA